MYDLISALLVVANYDGGCETNDLIPYSPSYKTSFFLLLPETMVVVGFCAEWFFLCERWMMLPKAMMIVNLILLSFCSTETIGAAPNILLIVADDLGYNDVSWHNHDIRSPNLENLAKTGVLLEQSYVLPVCSPTRAALLTGLYPIHTGRQHSVISPEEPRGLFTNLTTLPSVLKQLGEQTNFQKLKKNRPLY